MRSVLMVQNREAIAAGTYDVDEDLARKWQGLGFDEHAAYAKRFEAGEYQDMGEEVEEDRRRWEGELAGRTSEMGDERAGEDVEMEDDVEDESE